MIEYHPAKPAYTLGEVLKTILLVVELVFYTVALAFFLIAWYISGPWAHVYFTSVPFFSQYAFRPFSAGVVMAFGYFAAYRFGWKSPLMVFFTIVFTELEFNSAYAIACPSWIPKALSDPYWDKLLILWISIAVATMLLLRPKIKLNWSIPIYVGWSAYDIYLGAPIVYNFCQGVIVPSNWIYEVVSNIFLLAFLFFTFYDRKSEGDTQRPQS